MIGLDRLLTKEQKNAGCSISSPFVHIYKLEANIYCRTGDKKIIYTAQRCKDAWYKLCKAYRHVVAGLWLLVTRVCESVWCGVNSCVLMCI